MDSADKAKVLAINSAKAYAVENKFRNFFYSLRNPLTFADSTYILRSSFTVAESTKTSCICLLQIPQQIKCTDKTYVTSICTRNPRKAGKWNPLTL